MSFTGKESEIVSLQDAATWTANYRSTIKSGEIISHFFGQENINSILNQRGCVGIRMYHGIDNGKKNIVLVGVDANENDLIEGTIVEKGVNCPPRCPKANELNS